MIDGLADALGGLAVLVNNAGANHRAAVGRRHARGLAAGARGQPHRAVPVRAGGGAADGRDGHARADRQRHLDPRARAAAVGRRVLRRQGRARDADQGPGARAGAARDHGQRGRAGPHRDADDRQGRPRPARRSAAADPARPARRRRRRSPRSSRCWPRAATPPARRCSSTAACRSARSSRCRGPSSERVAAAGADGAGADPRARRGRDDRAVAVLPDRAQHHEPRLPDVDRRGAGARPAAGDPHARDRPLGRRRGRARRRGRRDRRGRRGRRLGQLARRAGAAWR